MRKLLKETKKGGFRGYCARERLKTVCWALLLLFAVATVCVLSGGTAGIISGIAFATAPIVGFALPEGVDFTENEKKGLSALADHFNKQFQEFTKGTIDKAEALEKMDEKLKSWGETNGVDKSTLEKMRESLKEQGKALESLKEQAKAPAAKLGGLKAAFYEKFDDLAKAVKEKRENFLVKAVDGHDDDLIHTTDNVITTTTGSFLPEDVRNDPNLVLKRRDREYIHDIASVSVVEKVPEVFTFTEEGDAEGNIAVITENGLKPQVHLSLIKNQVEAKKAAGYIVVTEEVLKWRSRAWAAILRLFRDKVYRDYEDILTTQMLGEAVSYIGTPLDGTIENPTNFDAVIAAILQLEQLNFQPNTMVINPADKWKLAMTTTPNGMFILPYIQQGGSFALLGLRVITTNKVAAGTFLLGESSTWFIEEEPPQVRTGLVNDDFIHNRMTIVGEIFFLSYVPSNNAGAWVSGSFADIKEALAWQGVTP